MDLLLHWHLINRFDLRYINYLLDDIYRVHNLLHVEVMVAFMSNDLGNMHHPLMNHWHGDFAKNLKLLVLDTLLDNRNHRHMALFVPRHMHVVVNVRKLNRLNGLLDYSCHWHMDLILNWHINHSDH